MKLKNSIKNLAAWVLVLGGLMLLSACFIIKQNSVNNKIINQKLDRLITVAEKY